MIKVHPSWNSLVYMYTYIFFFFWGGGDSLICFFIETHKSVHVLCYTLKVLRIF